MPLTTTEYGIKSHLDYGANEGIYLDLWILIHTDIGVKEQKLGTSIRWKIPRMQDTSWKNSLRMSLSKKEPMSATILMTLYGKV